MTAKLGDFGLAVALDKSRLTQAGMMVGTVSYMPPEQAMGGEPTPCSDLYSLGAMLYEMLTGRPPFVGDESVAIITQHLNTPPVAPSGHRPDYPPALETLILRLVEKGGQAARGRSRGAGGAGERAGGSGGPNPPAPFPEWEGGEERLRRRWFPSPARGGVRGEVRQPDVPPHLRRPRTRAAPAPGAYDAAVSGRGSLRWRVSPVLRVSGSAGRGCSAGQAHCSGSPRRRGGTTSVRSRRAHRSATGRSWH
jgi:hypothetical protein